MSVIESSELDRHTLAEGLYSTIVNVHRNDPSAGSPTDTVLRLLHPLNDKAHATFFSKFRIAANTDRSPWSLPDHPIG